MTHKLTNNEKKVLKKLVENSKITDSTISEEINISQQAVQQIRKKLEDEGIIERYSPVINYKKIGIKMLHFMGIKILTKLWERMSEFDITKKLKDIPFLYMFTRIPTGDISYILIFGFRSIEEMERFTKRLESELAGEMRVVWSYTSSLDNFNRENTNLIRHVLDRNETDIKGTLDKIKK